MTILEFLKSNDAETIAKKLVYDINSPISNGFSIGYESSIFNWAFDCPEECENLCQWDSSEDSWMNGACWLDEDEECPYHVDRNESVCRQVVEWLNSEMDARE